MSRSGELKPIDLTIGTVRAFCALLGVEEKQHFYYIFSCYSNMSSFRNKNNNSRKTRKPRPSRNLKSQLLNISERKLLTESSHHFPLVQLAAMTYSDSGIFTDGWTCTNRIAQGTSNNQRIGNTVNVTRIDYTFNVFAPSGSPDTARILVIRDRAPKGTVPLLGNMLDDPNNNLSCIAPNSRKQYKIVAEHLLDVGGIYLTRSIKFSVLVKGETTYFGQLDNLASIQNNAYYIIIISVNGTGATECLQFWSSCHFSDL